MSLVGRIEDIGVVDVMQMVHLGQRSGTLFVWKDPRRAAIMFELGRIVRVWSTEFNRLSDLLRAQRLVSDADLSVALRMQANETNPRKLQDILLSSGLITKEGLSEAVEHHIARLIREVTSWKRGSFEFTQEARLIEPPGSAAALDAIPPAQLSVEFMLLEAARLTDELRQPQAPQVRSPSEERVFDTIIPEQPKPPPRAARVASDDDMPAFNLLLKGKAAEQQVSRLMSLYVATWQLHSSLDPSDVQRAISDVTINLLGAEQFVLLLRDEGSPGLVVEMSEGISGRPTPYSSGHYLGGEPLLDACLRDGRIHVAAENVGGIRAAVPLKFQGDVVGALAIIKMLQHKPIFGEDDRELLHLLGMHAASALYAARLYSRTDRKLKTLEALINLIRADGGGARVA